MESTGRLPPEGVLGELNFHADGLFDECLDVRAPGDRFSGQYCTLFFKSATVSPSDEIVKADPDDEASEYSIRWILLKILREMGVNFESGRLKEPKVSGPSYMTAFFPSLSLCLPSSCRAGEVRQSVAELIGRFIVANQSVVTIADDRYCFSQKEADKPPTFDAPDIAVL